MSRLRKLENQKKTKRVKQQNDKINGLTTTSANTTTTIITSISTTVKTHMNGLATLTVRLLIGRQ